MSRQPDVDYYSHLTPEQKAHIGFQFHCFGDRGSSSVESAAIGGFAHMTQFMGTDNFNALTLAEEYYDAAIASAYSVFATEHSTTTSRGREGEEQFVWEQLQANPDAPIMSFVADSYDVYKFTDMVTNPDGRIRKLLDSRPHQKFVIRPDSGDPIIVLERMLEIMFHNEVFADIGETTPKLISDAFSILWGDGITPETIEHILQYFTDNSYRQFMLASSTGELRTKLENLPLFAAENFVFGSGGDLMQNHTRDTQRFAVKCSSITVEHIQGEDSLQTLERIDIFKDPITDPGKKSKKGRVTTITDGKTFMVYDSDQPIPNGWHNALRPVFIDGKLFNEQSLYDIRNKDNNGN